MIKVAEKKENKTYQDIYDTINQSKLKPGSPQVPSPNPLEDLEQFDEPKGDYSQEPPAPSNIPEPPAPSYPNYDYAPSQISQRSGPEVQELVESLIEEKWEDFSSRVGDINLWKDRVNTELTAIKQEILRTQAHFMNLQKSVLGKIEDYNKNILNVNSEMQALEKVFQKILEPLSENIKELSRITNKMKSK